jgi:hypothetical protein
VDAYLAAIDRLSAYAVGRLAAGDPGWPWRSAGSSTG